MMTQNQYRGKCLYASDGAVNFSDIPKVCWDDVVLNDKVKNDIRLNTVTFLGDVKLANVGVAKRGLIMYGPPGTGKTSVVKSIFNELEGKKVSRIYVTNETFSSMRVSSLFDLLDYLGPSVLAFEDLDMIGTSRDIHIGSSGPLGDLLTNLDGMRKYHDPLVVIASTNKIEMMDSALTNRPARFDRKIAIGLPTPDLLKKLYAKFLGSEVSDEVVKMSFGFTGSHAFEVANTAKILAMNEGRMITDCVKEACQIIRDNFFPEQTTDQIHTSAIMKVASIKKGFIKTASKKKANVKNIASYIMKKI
jgi:SpoVK/Ycf46/Vps4 family AAA+-type ATPase